MSDDYKNYKKEQNSLVQSDNREIAIRSSNLVRRGLNHLSKRGSRTVSFPKNWSMGKLYIVSPDGDSWWRNDWENFGNAMGDIVVPKNKKLVLRIEEREVTDFAYIGEMSWIDNHQEQFTDLSPLACLNPYDLQGLDLRRAWIINSSDDANWSSPAYFQKLMGLEWLNLSGIHVGHLNFLKDLTNLRWVDLDETDVCSLAPLQKLTNLRYLSLCSTEIYDLEYLEDLVHLEELHLLETPVWDLSYLKGLSKLRVLDLRDTLYDETSEEVKDIKLSLPACEIWL